MMQHEFEALAGYRVTAADYDNIIDPMYMTTTFNNQYTAASLYDGGWRAEDRDQLIDEYQLTEEEADEICRELVEVEEEATAKEFEDYGRLKHISHEAFFEEGWDLVGSAEDEDGNAYDIVLSADKTEYRYTTI